MNEFGVSVPITLANHQDTLPFTQGRLGTRDTERVLEPASLGAPSMFRQKSKLLPF